MCLITDKCFMCINKEGKIFVDNRIVTQIEYILPEITIFKLGVPLHICSICEENLHSFSKFKHNCVENSLRLEERIKEAHCSRISTNPPLHPVSVNVNDKTESPGTSVDKFLEIYIKEEKSTYPDDYNKVVHDITEEDNVNTTNKNAAAEIAKQNVEEIFIKEEPQEETSCDREFYDNIVQSTSKEEYNNKDDNTITKDNSKPENTGSNDFSCSVCNQSFTSKPHLKKHMKTHNLKNHFQCEVCNKSFTLKYNLKTHMKIHTGTKNYECSVCNKLFTRSDNLKSHMIVHTGAKDFTCSICNRSFAQRTNLRIHMKIHSGVKDYQCPTCQKCFTHKVTLNNHLRTHSDVKEFKCPTCSKCFTYRITLVNHMKTHAGIKDFVCRTCNKGFTYRSTLINHMKTHTVVKEFQCIVCKKLFTRNDSLKAHMRNHNYVKD